MRTFDTLNSFGMDRDYKAAYEANKAAPHIYDRWPTPAEREQVQAACANLVKRQMAARAGAIVAGHNVAPPSAYQCELQHFIASAQTTYLMNPSLFLPPY